MTTTSRLEVDHKGWAKQYAETPKSKLIEELVQNGIDEPGVTRIDVTMKHEGPGVHRIIVRDDAPDGYHDIRHAWTLFAPSKKAQNPELRGIFNMGCKMVVALAIEARITSTKSAVEFSKEGGRKLLKHRTKEGTAFNGTFRMSIGEAIEAVAAARRMIVPSGIAVWVNDERIQDRELLKDIELTLPTRYADEEGNFRNTQRKTVVNVYKPLRHEVPTLYEMGIPVVELTGSFPWHVDVQQRVPLNMDRDNVTPAYLTKLRVAVLNTMYDVLDNEQATDTWVTDATSSPEAAPEAVSGVITKRFGEKRVVYDPSDPEGSKLAMSKGYTVVHGASLTRGQWDNVRRDSVMLPAGKVTPSPSVLSSADGIPPVEREDWAPVWVDVTSFTEWLWSKIGKPGSTSRRPSIKWFKHGKLWWAACWGVGVNLNFNAAKMPDILASWQEGDKRPLIKLLVHEFAHEVSGDHLSERYHDELCRMASELAYLDVEGLPR